MNSVEHHPRSHVSNFVLVHLQISELLLLRPHVSLVLLLRLHLFSLLLHAEQSLLVLSQDGLADPCLGETFKLHLLHELLLQGYVPLTVLDFL